MTVTCIRNAAWVVAWDAHAGQHFYRQGIDVAFDGGELCVPQGQDYAWTRWEMWEVEDFLFDVADRVPAFKLENLRALLTEADAARWHEVKSQVAARMGLARHRASADARLLQQTLVAVKQVAA